MILPVIQPPFRHAANGLTRIDTEWLASQVREDFGQLPHDYLSPAPPRQEHTMQGGAERTLEGLHHRRSQYEVPDTLRDLYRYLTFRAFRKMEPSQPLSSTDRAIP